MAETRKCDGPGCTNDLTPPRRRFCCDRCKLAAAWQRTRQDAARMRKKRQQLRAYYWRHRERLVAQARAARRRPEYDRQRQKRRERWAADGEQRSRAKEYLQSYHKRPEVKETLRRKRRRPKKVKAKAAYDREYRQRAEVKERYREYLRRWRAENPGRQRAINARAEARQVLRKVEAAAGLAGEK